MTILKSLLRIYFIEQAMDVLSQGLLFNLSPAPEADLRGYPRTEEGLLAYFRSGAAREDGIRDSEWAVKGFIKREGLEKTLSIIDEHLRTWKR
jgi:hypothetical protein